MHLIGGAISLLKIASVVAIIWAVIVGFFHYQKQLIERADRAGYERAKTEVALELNAEAAEAVQRAEEARRALSPTPADKNTLLLMCRDDEHCRERDQK